MDKLYFVKDRSKDNDNNYSLAEMNVSWPSYYNDHSCRVITDQIKRKYSQDQLF